MRQFIKRLNREQGTTVILTTHDMQDIEALTERILLIGKGRILLDGSLEELRRRASAQKTLVVLYSGAKPALSEGMALAESREGRMVIALDPSVCPVSEAISRIAAQTEVTDVSVSGISSEEMVAALYEEYNI